LIKIRNEKQGEMSWTDFALKMRGYQTAVGVNVVSDLQLVREMLFNMDPGLCRFLRAHNVLKKSGLHESDMDALGFSRASTALTSLVDVDNSVPTPKRKLKKKAVQPVGDDEGEADDAGYEEEVDFLLFDKVARERWIVIMGQKEVISKQVASGLKGHQKTSTTSANRSLSTKPASTTSPSSTTASTNSSSNRTPKLTARERAFLVVMKGCFSCRKTGVDHQSLTCPDAGKGLPPAPIVIPETWNAGDAAPTTATTAPASTTNLAPLQMFDEIETDSGEFSPDSQDESVNIFFPPLLTQIRGARKTRKVEALADSGASTSVITDELVMELGLEKVKLAKPSVVTLALKGKCKDSLTHRSICCCDDLLLGVSKRIPKE
jgi:hypothetical protein